MTLQTAKNQLRDFGMSVNVRDGEYRVNFLGGKEETAYYTNDLEDAVDTGRLMFQARNSEADHRAFVNAHAPTVR